MKRAKTTVVWKCMYENLLRQAVAGHVGVKISSLWKLHRQGLGTEVLTLTKKAMLLTTCKGRTNISTSLIYVLTKPRQVKTFTCVCVLLLAH